MGRLFLQGAGIAATAWAAIAAAAPMVIEGTDFDREAQRIQLQLQSSEIVTETGSGPTVPTMGMAGQSADRAARGDTAADSGSGWFNSYVDQVNRQLRLRAQAAPDRGNPG